MSEINIVYLIGFMGSGKSTAGKKLAASMGWNFIDLDRKIEEKAGKSIPRIFAEDGEDAFRRVESDVLRDTRSLKQSVISTGGGTPCHGDNLSFMLDTGFTIYLKMTPSQLAGRLLGSTGERPLLKNVPDGQLNEFIEKKLAIREEWYAKAHLIIDGMSLDISMLHALVNKGAGR
jgi:shikimate kinase